MIALLLLLYLCTVSGSELNTTEVNYIENPDVTIPLNFKISAAKTDPDFPTYTVTLPKTTTFGDIFASLGPTWKFDFRRVLSMEYSFIPGIPYTTAFPTTDWTYKISDIINGKTFLDNWNRTVYLKVYISYLGDGTTPPALLPFPPPPPLPPNSPPARPMTINVVFTQFNPAQVKQYSVYSTDRVFDLECKVYSDFTYERKGFNLALYYNGTPMASTFFIYQYNLKNGDTIVCSKYVMGGGYLVLRL